MTVSRAGAGCTAKFWQDPRADNVVPTRWFRSLGVVLAALLALPAWCQDKKDDLADRSLEDLMNTQVTSVSKREQKLSDAAAAIFVITQEDIRRSGATTIPDLLRMVPGVEVAQINANSWAISIRGFNSEFATKILVLIDGRSVYSPLFSGVYWDVQDTVLEDIDRIEVIRGPGATVWGANAVNGVINIITRGAGQTQGGLVTVASGNQELGSGAARYGGKIGEKAFYRAFVKYFDRGDDVALPGNPSQDDRWQIGRGGFRMDWQMSARDSLMVEGDIYGGAVHEVVSPVISFSPPFTQTLDDRATLGGGDVLARWTRTLSSSSDMSLQFYFDRTNRNGAVFGENRNTYDLDFQDHLTAGARQDIVWGLGYRLTSDEFGARFSVSLSPPHEKNQLFSLFGQDEIKIVPHHLFLTVGTKVEHNDFTGFEVQPNVRLLWTPSANQSLWAAVSRAVRTPSRSERSVDIILQEFSGPGGIPYFVTVSGDPGFRSEDLLAYELGYRVQPTSRLSLDITTYYNFYTHLRTSEQGMPVFELDPAPHVLVPITLENKARGETYGVEFAANWNVTRWWRVSPGYSWLREGLRLDASSTDTGTVATARDNPNSQFQLRSFFNLPHRVELDSNLYFVGRLVNQAVPAYTRFDVRLGWRPNESVEVSGVFQNAFQPLHQEFGNPGLGGAASLLRRGAYAKLVWKF